MIPDFLLPNRDTIVPKIDAVILTVLPEEYQAVCSLISNLNQVSGSDSDRNTYVWQIGSVKCTQNQNEYQVAVGMIGRPGPIESALAATNAIERWHPRYVFLVGVAGGLGNSRKGDVVIADVVYGYEYGKIDWGFKPRSNWTYNTDQGLLNIALSLKDTDVWKKHLPESPTQTDPKVHSGEIASGDKVVDNPSNEFFAQVLEKWPKIQAVEMEGVGVGEAIEHARMKGHDIGFMMIRGISDLPRTPNDELESDIQRGSEERDNWKLFASAGAAAFTFTMIQSGLPVAPGNPLSNGSSEEFIYRDALKRNFDEMVVPGSSLVGRMDEIFVWPNIYEVTSDHYSSESQVPPSRRLIDLRTLLESQPVNIVIAAGTGCGKTTLLAALAHHYAHSHWLPGFISLPELSEKKQTILDFLNTTLNQQFSCNVPWVSYCTSGKALLLLDGFDELTPGEQRRIIELISKFSNRYTHVSLLLTVRDTVVVTALPRHRKFTIDPLKPEQIQQFVKAYQKAGSLINEAEFFHHIQMYPDIKRLACIPFFLALLLATARPSQSLLHQRSEIMDCYLHFAFRPEETKPSMQLHHDPNHLRDAAEFVAFNMLDGGKAGLTEQDVFRLIEDFIGSQPNNRETYIVDLTACGILQRSPTWIRFVFPVVQEYLAACYLVRQFPDQLLEWFTRTIQRPWDQILQFSLEKHNQADQLICELLNEPDDAVVSNLQLISRAIIQGAKVTDQTRSIVGDRLAEAWMSGSWSIQNSIGDIIANGFYSPLPSKVRQLLKSSWGLSIGGAEIIIAKCKDPALTLDALKAFLDRDLTHSNYLHGWQSAVDAVALDAIKLYLKRVRDKKTTDAEISSLASLISWISPEALSPNHYRLITDNDSLPPIIRLGGYFLGPCPFPDDFYILADKIIRTPVKDNRYGPQAWHMAISAIWNGTKAKERWLNYVNDPDLALDQCEAIIEAILDSPFEDEDKRHALSQLNLSGTLSNEFFDLIQILQSYLGDEHVMRALTNRLASLSYDHLSMWAIVLNRYHATDIAYTALNQIRNLKLDDRQKAKLANTFAISLTSSDVEIHSSGVSSAYGSMTQMASSEYAKMIWEWSNTFDGDAESCLVLLEAACQLGYPGAVDSLAKELICCLEYPELFQDFGFDNTYSNALGTLETAGRELPIVSLMQCAKISNANAKRQAIERIASYNNADAFDFLLELHALKTDEFVRGWILSCLEELARNIGTRLVWKDGRLSALISDV